MICIIINPDTGQVLLKADPDDKQTQLKSRRNSNYLDNYFFNPDDFFASRMKYENLIKLRDKYFNVDDVAFDYFEIAMGGLGEFVFKDQMAGAVFGKLARSYVDALEQMMTDWAHDYIASFEKVSSIYNPSSFNAFEKVRYVFSGQTAPYKYGYDNLSNVLTDASKEFYQLTTISKELEKEMSKDSYDRLDQSAKDLYIEALNAVTLRVRNLDSIIKMWKESNLPDKAKKVDLQGEAIDIEEQLANSIMRNIGCSTRDSYVGINDMNTSSWRLEVKDLSKMNLQEINQYYQYLRNNSIKQQRLVDHLQEQIDAIPKMHVTNFEGVEIKVNNSEKIKHLKADLFYAQEEHRKIKSEIMKIFDMPYNSSSSNDLPFSLTDIYETFPGVRAALSSLDPFDPENTFSAEPFSQVKISPELIETMNLTSEQVLKLKDSALQMKLALELSGQSIESFSQDSDILNQNYAKLIIDSANLVNTLKVEQQQFKDDIALINHKDELLSLKDRYAELNADIPKGLQEWIDKLEKLENSAKDTGGKVQKTGEQFQRLRNSTKKTIPLAQQLAAEFTSVGHSLSNLSIIASSLNLPGAELFGITGSGALNIAAGLNNWNLLDTKDNVSFLDYASVGSQIATSLLSTFDNLFGRFGLFGSASYDSAHVSGWMGGLGVNDQSVITQKEYNAHYIPFPIYINNDMDVAPYNNSNKSHYLSNETLDRCKAAA